MFETTGPLSGHIADGRGHVSTYVCCMSRSHRAMVAMVELNAQAMTDKFLNSSWSNSFSMTMDDGITPADRTVWRRIRDIYAAEIDRRNASDAAKIEEAEARVLDGNR